jgi:hypothetical protein
MKNLRGNHTTLIPLAQEVCDLLSKKVKSIEFSPGFITRKNVKIKQVSIILENEISSVLMNVLMKGSKQFVRIYNVNILEIEKVLKDFSKEKQINLKIK